MACPIACPASPSKLPHLPHFSELPAPSQLNTQTDPEDPDHSTFTLLQAWREADSQQWQPCSWQQLDLELSAARRRSRATHGWQVLLRAPVGHLQQLWHLRLQVCA
jgi:hypothetical protein